MCTLSRCLAHAMPSQSTKLICIITWTSPRMYMAEHLHSWKNAITPRNEVPFWRLFIFCLLVRSKSRLIGSMYGFLCIVCTISFHMYFGKFVMTVIHIGEIGWMNIPDCHWMVIVINLSTQTWLFALCCLLVWFCACWFSVGYCRL